MAEELQRQLRDVGSKLQNLSSTGDTLAELLEQAGTCLSKLDQLSSKSMLEPMQPFLNAIVEPELLKHQDGDIKLLVATCVCEITRITAPEAPYSDEILRDIFRLIVSTFTGLSDTSGPSFDRRVAILDTLARYRSCVVLLDLECDDLVIEVFRTFFAVVSDDHSENVRTSMQTIMVNLLEESEDVPEDLLLALLSVLGRNKNNVSRGARRLAMNVIQGSAVKLEPGIRQFLISSMSGDSKALCSQIDYHEVIYDIYGCASQILSGVIPYLTGELMADLLDTRLKAVRLLGDLFSLPGSTVSEAFQPIFSEFLMRLTDQAVEIRMSVLEHVKMCLLSNPSRAKAPQILSDLVGRLLDDDENVRKQVVSIIHDLICHAPTSIPVETTKLVAERLQDKSLIVKKHTMESLAEIHKHCLGVSDGSIKPSEFDWIPRKILICLYDKDFRSDTIESFLCGFLSEFSVKSQVEHWVRIFSAFDKGEVKALEKILEQKQRLQLEMQRYLSLRQMHQNGDAPEYQKKVIFFFKIMSRCFSDPVKAEDNFQILDQLKDSNVWKILTTLLDPNTSFLQACSLRDDLLKIVGEKHELYDFLGTLSIKCSYLPFSKEHVKKFLVEADRQKSGGCSQLASSCMNLLIILAHFSPLLLNGTEENLVQLLKDDSGAIKEGALQVLAKAGESIREQLGTSSSSLELMLERICLEGSRRQAKHAVHALAAITKDDGLKSLSVLYKRLVDMLEEKMHLPAVLQSLGCIAQTAMPVFETREGEVEEFIKSKILECSDVQTELKAKGDNKIGWDDKSELCSLKIFGIKTLVKSYLPVKDAHLRLGIDKLLGVLKNLLSFGEISKDIESSSVDKAHLRLASAKAVLRLSRRWDHKIPVDVFFLTLRTSEISFPEARKLFLDKVYQYTKDHVLDPKYTCVFSFNMIELQQPEFEEGKRKLADIVQTFQQMKAGQLPTTPDAKPEMSYLEKVLPYFVHVLAHHSSCPNVEICKDVKAFEITYRQLHFFLSMMVHGIEDYKSKEITDKNREIISTITSIFQSIKRSEDVVDTSKSKNSHAICDLGLLIIKRLAGKKEGLQCLTAPARLPPMLYKSHEKKEDDDALVIEENSWLSDESVLIHLEPSNLNTNETVQSENFNGQPLNDNEGDGNDVPLGKMLKHLKVQGPRVKTMVKKTNSAVGTKNAVNDVDILKMVREINLDNLGVSSKFESTNGYENLPSQSKSDKKDQKKKRKIASDAMSTPVPKRRRSSSAHPALKFCIPLRNPKGFLRASNDTMPQADVPSSIEMESEPRSRLEDKLSAQKCLADPAQSGLLVSGSQKKSSTSSKRKDRGSDRIYNEAERGDDYLDGKKHNLTTETGRIKEVSKSKFPVVSAKKRKRRSIAGLAKCSVKEVGSHTTDLIDCRVKVWWPMDKQFYEGVVKSYDPKKKKHEVLYDDGDVEVLFLEKERWELIDSSQNSSKRLNPSKSAPSKEVSRELESKISGGSHQSKKQIKRVRGKRTPRKNLKHNARGASKSKTFDDSREAENEAGSNVSTSEPASGSKADDVISGDLEGEQIKEMERSPKGGEESDAEGKSASEGKQTAADSEKSVSATDGSEEMKPFMREKQVEDTLAKSPGVNGSGEQVKSCLEEAKPDSSGEASMEESGNDESSKSSEGNRADEDAESTSTDSDKLDKKTKDSSDSHGEGASDNETLNMWRRRTK